MTAPEPASKASASKSPPLGDERVLLRTNRGDLVLGLYDSVAPKHAAQIRKLVRAGVYDSTIFFRVEPGFVVQIVNAQNRRNPLTREQHAAITPIPAEFSELPHRAGSLSMARDDDDVNSAETSFSIVLGRARELDRKYTVFGELAWGKPVLAVIAREPRDKNNRPFNPIIVERAEVKTAAQIEQMRAAGELRGPTAPPKAAPSARPR